MALLRRRWLIFRGQRQEEEEAPGTYTCELSLSLSAQLRSLFPPSSVHNENVLQAKAYGFSTLHARPQTIQSLPESHGEARRHHCAGIASCCAVSYRTHRGGRGEYISSMLQPILIKLNWTCRKPS